MSCNKKEKIQTYFLIYCDHLEVILYTLGDRQQIKQKSAGVFSLIIVPFLLTFM